MHGHHGIRKEFTEINAYLLKCQSRSLLEQLTGILFIYLFAYLFIYLAVLRLCCYTRSFSSCGEWGLLLVAARGLLIAVDSLVMEHRL